MMGIRPVRLGLGARFGALSVRECRRSKRSLYIDGGREDDEVKEYVEEMIGTGSVAAASVLLLSERMVSRWEPVLPRLRMDGRGLATPEADMVARPGARGGMV